MMKKNGINYTADSKCNPNYCKRSNDFVLFTFHFFVKRIHLWNSKHEKVNATDTLRFFPLCLNFSNQPNKHTRLKISNQIENCEINNIMHVFAK